MAGTLPPISLELARRERMMSCCDHSLQFLILFPLYNDIRHAASLSLLDVPKYLMLVHLFLLVLLSFLSQTATWKKQAHVNGERMN